MEHLYVDQTGKRIICFLGFFLPSVAVGGLNNVVMDARAYAAATSVKKPSKCALMILDALIPESVLIKSTVNGTKDVMPINTNIMAIFVEMISFSLGI